MSSKVRCESERIKTVALTFGSDQTIATFGYVAAQGLIYHVLAAVDVSVDAVGEPAYEVERILAPKPTGQTWTAGDQLFYDISAGKFRNATADALDLPAGQALEAAGTAATEGMMHFIGDRARRPKIAGASR